MRKGFTIVELLIVIVVIAILAAITVVAYNGIQDRAKSSAASQALSTAAQKIKYWQAERDTTTAPDCTAFSTTLGVSPASCSPTVGNTNYQYTQNLSGTYCITATVGNQSYTITGTNNTPAEGGCAGHGQGGVAPVTNLALNPSAETNSGWLSNNGTIYPASADSTIKRTGSQSRSSSNTNGSLTLLSLYSVGGDSGASAGVPISQSGEYTISIYFRADVPHQSYIRAAYRLGGVYTSLTGPTVTGTPGAWTRVSFTFTVPAGADMLRPVVDVLSLSTQPVGTKAWVDDIMITYGNVTHSYADGNTSDWVWNGTANNATSTGPPQ